MLFLGEIVSHFTGIYLVSSVAGLLILFLLLCLKAVKPESIAAVCDLITGNMMLFFVVPGAGLIDHLGTLGHNLLRILIPVILSSLFGLYVTAKVTELLLRRKNGRKEAQ